MKCERGVISLLFPKQTSEAASQVKPGGPSNPNCASQHDNKRNWHLAGQGFHQWPQQLRLMLANQFWGIGVWHHQPLCFSRESLKFSTTFVLPGTLPSSKHAESWSLPVVIRAELRTSKQGTDTPSIRALTSQPLTQHPASTPEYKPQPREISLMDLEAH